MGRTLLRRLAAKAISAFLAFAATVALAGCEAGTPERVCVGIEFGVTQTTRSALPDEDRISDVAVFIFNSSGYMEDRIFRDSGERLDITLLRGCGYTIFACANLGYRPNLSTLEQVREFRCHFSRPDDFSRGIPMSACLTKFIAPEKDCTVRIELERTMARLTLMVDKSRLDEGVNVDITEARIGGEARSVSMFAPSRAMNEDDLFPAGYWREWSRGAEIYLTENLSGNDELTGTYVEIRAQYDSPKLYTAAGQELIYRFRLGDVTRNSHYTVTVIPEGDGLGDSRTPAWRIDRSGLSSKYDGSPWFRYYPANYIEGHIGDVIRVWCEFSPPDAPFDIGIEELERDRREGIYDYVLDKDGKGVTLTLKGKGTGILYPSAGPPVNESAAIMIVCEP